jgi:hypothetical protein
MSVRTELEELVKWISDLQADKEPAQKPETLHREVWQAVDRDLERAAERFAQASVAVAAQDPKSIVAEFARDLEREAQGLALRAHLLSRRAPREANAPHQPHAKTKTLTAAGHSVESADQATGEAPIDEKPEEPKKDGAEARPPGELVKSAADTVETAHARLEAVEHPDHVVKSFEEELDVLAEMTLSLRQKCEALDAGRPG